MEANEWGLNRRDFERVRSVVGDSERVVMVVKPRLRMSFATAFPSLLLGTMIAGFLGMGAYMFAEKWWVTVLLFSPFWLLALVLLSTPQRYRWRMARTLYVLTNKRAIVFEQRRLWHNRCISWPLFPRLVKRVTKDGHNLGSLIFDYEVHYSFDARKRAPLPVGFLNVPRPDVVQQLVQEQVEAVPPNAAPYAFRPAVLRGPVPRLNAEGAPLAEQPWESRDEGRYLVIFGAVWALFSSIFVGAGLCMLYTESRLADEGVQTIATVTKMRVERSSGGATSYYPTLRFKDTAGRTHTVDYHIDTDNYSRGDKLPIVYLPDEPDTLRVVEDGMSPGTYFALAGSAFVLIGCGMMIIGYKMKKKK
ncbi:MAG: DUF3592 domain-containing protein [Akkermansia sp.]|nr:DUF3592 domain-containing protein [Akkermansia sp.]